MVSWSLSSQAMDLFLCNLKEIIFNMSEFGDAMPCRNLKANTKPAGSETCNISLFLHARAAVLYNADLAISLEPAAVCLHWPATWSHFFVSFVPYLFKSMLQKKKHFEVDCYHCRHAWSAAVNYEPTNTWDTRNAPLKLKSNSSTFFA